MTKTEIKLLPSKVERLRLDLIDRNPRQPRQTFSEESLLELASNIISFGYMIYAILVKPNPHKPGRYEIVAGERRFRALQLIGIEEFDFHVAESEIPSYIISIIENDNRENLNPMDEAEAYRECLEREKMSVVELAKFTGKQTFEIYQAMRLLKLAPEVQELVRQRKIKKGMAFNLVQYKNFAHQIKFAQQIIAGENPPELDERLTEIGKSQDARIIARLPETAEGLIRRLLQWRQRSNPVPFVADALLRLPEPDQLEGWRHFTQQTRENFEKQLRALVVNLQALEERMKTLPETKKLPFGRSVPKTTPAAVKQPSAAPQRTIPPPPPPPTRRTEPPPEIPRAAVATRPVFAGTTPVLKPAQRTAAQVRVPEERPELQPGKKPEAEKQPMQVELEAAEKILVFISTQIRQGNRDFLGKQSLANILGNGGSPENVEALAVRALGLIRTHWRAPPDREHPEKNRFISVLSQRRHDLGYATFEQFMNVVKNRDNSADPINLKHL